MEDEIVGLERFWIDGVSNSNNAFILQSPK
jgi:hypothetical protein